MQSISNNTHKMEGVSNRFQKDYHVKNHQGGIVKQAVTRNDDGVVVKSNCNSATRNKNVLSYHALPPHTAHVSPQVFHHDIRGAAKRVGVTFDARLPHKYLKQKSCINKDCSIGEYLRVVSTVTYSGAPNYNCFRI